MDCNESMDWKICFRKNELIGRLIVSHIFLIAFFVNFIFSSNLNAGDYKIDQFVGPFPGYRYIYESGNNISVELLGLSKENNGVFEVEEITDLTAINLPPNMEKIISHKYKVLIVDDAIIKQIDNSKEIILQEPFISNLKKWEIVGKAGSGAMSQKNISFEDVVTLCKIVHTGKENILGKKRFVITTECITKYQDSTVIRFEKYAEGIGLVERVIKSVSNNNKGTEVFRITLKEITKIEGNNQE